MAIYLRTCPTTGIKVLGCLGALAAAGIALLYPLILLMTAFALGALDEAVAYPEDNESIANAAIAVGATPLIFSFVLTSVIFGATSCFTGTDRRLPKDTTAIHRDITSAQFLHIAQSPSRRATGMLQWTLASILLATSPVIGTVITLLLVPNESTPKLEENAFLGVVSLVMGLIVALAWAGTRRRMSSVCMTPQGMAVVKPFPSGLPLPSGRNNFSIQEVPALWGRVTVRAVYTPPTGGTEPGRPVLIPRLSLTVKPSRLDDTRSRVETRLDEVWRAAQLIRASVEQEETADAPTSEPAPNPTHQSSHQDADPGHDQSQAETPLP